MVGRFSEGWLEHGPIGDGSMATLLVRQMLELISMRCAI